MKKIMVLDVPAESGGALTVLNDFYRDYQTDLNNKYVFDISKTVVRDQEYYPWIKKSYVH